MPMFRRHYRELRSVSPGCFGLPGLHRADDWPKIADSCISDCASLVESIRAQTEPTPFSLQLFDDLSDRLCRVMDVAELCRNVHPQIDFVHAAHDAYTRVSTVIQHLNADSSIYEPLRNLYNQHQHNLKSGAHQKNILSQEDAIMVKSLKEDFERGGIGLKRNEKSRLIELQQEINSLSSTFLSPNARESTFLRIHTSKLNLLPRSVYSAASLESSVVDYINIPATSTNIQLILKWCRDSSIREMAYRYANNSSSPRAKILDSLLEKRHEVASALGHKSYAELMFSDRLAPSPSEVLSFLHQLSRLVGENAVRERGSLEDVKRRMEPQASHIGRSGICGWDRSFYMGHIRAQDSNISSAFISQFFSLQTCLSALSDIVNHIFGIQLNRVRASPGELWHRNVEKVAAVDENGDPVGYIYLDLYPRAGKYSHAAHFSITCGRQPLGQSTYQIPVVALVCNFGGHSKTNERLLSISEYETLFHEFGHSLHSILSRTKYQHLSGTRVSTDLVEVPSHVFEHFAWDPRIISKYARHYRTGEPMATNVVKSLCSSRNSFNATDVQLQILFSAMDLHFHGEDPPIGRTTKTFTQLQRELTVYEPDNGVAVPLTFHHIVGYGAGYYSYIFARILSALIWHKSFEKNPFSREGGNHFRHGFLALGASREGGSIIQNLLPGPTTCDAFLRSVGVRDQERNSALELPLRKKA